MLCLSAIESRVGQQRTEFDTCDQWGDADGIEAVLRQEEKADAVAGRISQGQDHSASQDNGGHLRPLGVGQNKPIPPKFESRSSRHVNPESQQAPGSAQHAGEEIRCLAPERAHGGGNGLRRLPTRRRGGEALELPVLFRGRPGRQLGGQRDVARRIRREGKDLHLDKLIRRGTDGTAIGQDGVGGQALGKVFDHGGLQHGGEGGGPEIVGECIRRIGAARFRHACLIHGAGQADAAHANAHSRAAPNRPGKRGDPPAMDRCRCASRQNSPAGRGKHKAPLHGLFLPKMTDCGCWLR